MIEELLVEQLRDLVHAEGQLVKALPKMVNAARAESLKLAFDHHLEEAKMQVRSAERGVRAAGYRREEQAMQGHGRSHRGG